MKGLRDKVFFPDCSHNDSDIDDYFTRDESFGEFIENGRAYVINRRDTPRAWVQYLCNDKMRSAVSNTGKGFIFHATGVSVTKHYETNGNYLPRNVNGERKLLVKRQNNEEVREFFTESQNFKCIVRPGYVTFTGDIEQLHIEVTIFVPQQAPCECWNVQITNTSTVNEEISVCAMQDIQCTEEQESKECKYNSTKSELQVTIEGVKNIFTANVVDAAWGELYFENDDIEDKVLSYLRETISARFNVLAGANINWNVVSSACTDAKEEEQIRLYTNASTCVSELKNTVKLWDEIIEHNYCELPDKNFEWFLNIWLKNQIYLTYRYDRSSHLIGYRDGLQDSWGYMLLQPQIAKEKMLLCLSYMLPDGRCPRQFSKFNTEHDRRDFSDSPVWAPIALSSYIKETGDFAIFRSQ